MKKHNLSHRPLLTKKNIKVAFFILLAIMLTIVIGIFEWNSATSEGTALELVLFPIIPVFLGALLAYQVQQIAEQRKIEDSRVEALQRNLIKLTSMLNDIASLEHVLDEYKGEDREKRLPPIIAPNSYERINASELAFIIELSDDYHILQELSAFQGFYDRAIFSLQERNRLYRKFFLPKLSKENITSYSDPNLDKIMKSDFGKKLKAETDNLYQHIPEMKKSGLNLANKLAHVSKNLYQHRTFILPRLRGKEEPEREKKA